MVEEIVEDCIHCGKCTSSCEFLKKYNIDLYDFSKRKDLAYHCFMCEKCASVCPYNINGKKISLKLREEIVDSNNGKILDGSYKGLLLEKNPYKFVNYRRGKKKSVVFTGCNFPAFYPKTTNYLMRLFRNYDIGIIYDCCGKPIEELGLKEDTERGIKKINDYIEKNKVEEMIMLCPDCYHFLKGRLNVEIVSIYKELRELELGRKIEKSLPMYYPCPDRENKEILNDIRYFLKEKEQHAFPDTQCCGLGGCASVKEVDISIKLAKSVQSTEYKELYTYCASCIGNFRRKGLPNAFHVLPEILEVKEEVPLDFRPLLNRALCKVK
jgi:fumarate reductase (CoM/CoB) subunit B